MKRISLVLAFLSSPVFATDPHFGAIRIEAAPNITHAFVSGKSQGDDATKVSKNEWNAAHVGPVALIASVPTGFVWPAQPAAVTEFCGASTSWRWRANLTNYSTVRLTAQVISAGAASAALRLQYTTDTTGATGWDYLDGVSGPSVTVNATGVTVSATVSIATSAKADVLLRLIGINGDGAGGSACYSTIRAATATLADSATTAATATTATTATALGSNGSNCSAGSAAQGVDAAGNAEGCFAVPSGTGTVSGTNTGDQSTITGNAGTATALAADGSNCGAGQFAAGVDASGSAQGCAALPTTISGTANQIAVSGPTGAITLSIPDSPTLPGTTTGTFVGNLTGNVTGASDLADQAGSLLANGANCSPGSAAMGVDDFGAAEGCFAVPSGTGTVSGTNTGDQTITLTGGVTGSGTGSFAATVVTNANLTGPITSVGNATTVAETELAALAGLTSAQNKIPIFTGSGTAGLFDAAIGNSCTDSVGSDAYACSSSTCPTALADGQHVKFTAGTLNTGAATFAYCGLAAKAIVRAQGASASTALSTGDILAKQPVDVVYNATDDNWKMVSSPASDGLVNTSNTWTQPQLFQDGSATAPSWGWSSDADGTGTGAYRRAANRIAWTFNGVGGFEFSDGTIYMPGGTGYTFTTTLGGGLRSSLYSDATGLVRSGSTKTKTSGFLGGGAAVASATALPLPTGRVFHVTGTTTVTSITSTNFESGAVITIIFDGILTFTDGSNLKLNGNFVTTADDTITLVYDGTSWYEIARSVN